MDDEDEGVAHQTEVSIGELIERRLSRRGALFGLAGTAARRAFGGGTAQAQKGWAILLHLRRGAARQRSHASRAGRLRGAGPDPLGRSGVAGRAAFDPAKQSGAGQALQFGYNNDFLGLHPLPQGSTAGRPRPDGASTTSTRTPT